MAARNVNAQTVNVVGLFETADRAAAVIQELTKRGFRRDQIDLTTKQSIGTNDLHGHITGLGAPAREAQFWAQGVHSGGTLLSVHTTQDRVDEAMEILDRMGARSVQDAAALHQQQHTSAAGVTSSGATHAVANETVIPVVEEQITVGKQQVERGGVRVLTRVTETPVQEQVTLREEHVTVDRRPVDRPVTEADRATFREGAIELTERAEEAVVSKQAHVVEEVVVGKETSERTETVQDTVRRTVVDVEQLTPGGQAGVAAARDFSTYETDFRSDFQSRYASNRGVTYEQYQPAYRYGYDLARDPRYAGRDWSAVAPEVRRDWEARHAGSPWERFQDSIRFAWERGRGAGHTTAAASGAPGNRVPGVQTGGRAVDGTPDTRGVAEKVADAVTGDRVDDKTGKPVR
jgi:uncharacterized protein (TIGR02271 family)